MRTTLGALTMLALVAAAHAEVPPGPDAVHGSFTRMLGHQASNGWAAAATPGSEYDAYVERWIDAAARNELNSLEAGFVHMLERCDEVPRAPVVRGEPDPFGAMVAAALQAQQHDGRRLAAHAAPGPRL